MTYAETIAGPWGPTTGSPLGARLCWEVTAARLTGPRISARLVMPGADWMRLGADGIRRPDLRVALATDNGAAVLLTYDTALIRESRAFLAALKTGEETTFQDQYMRMVPQFDTADERYSWLTESLFIGQGRLSGHHEVEYEIYRIT
jgi:hypothetical protein